MEDMASKFISALSMGLQEVKQLKIIRIIRQRN